MSTKETRILAIRPGQAVTVSDLPSDDWEYLHAGWDCTLISPHVYAMTEEWGCKTGADMVLFSSPEKRVLTRRSNGPVQCFQVLGELGGMGLLYVLGNKFFSRKLVAKLPGTHPIDDILTAALPILDSILTFSYPWVKLLQVPTPPDEEVFIRLVEHYADRQGQ